MEWDTLRAALDVGLATRRRAIRFTFYGGEPLLEFRAIRRAVLYAKRNAPPAKEVAFSVVTNGTLLTREAARFLARHDVRLHLSFDGVEAAQDLRGPGTFARLDRLLRRLRRDHPRWFRERVTVTSVLLPETVRHLASSVRYFIGAGVAGIAVTPTIGPTPSWRANRIVALEREYRRVAMLCYEHWRGTGEIPVLGLLPPARAGKSRARPERISFCGAPLGETPAVDVDGQWLGCGLLSTSFQRFPDRALEVRIESLRIGRSGEAGFRRRYAAFPEAARRARLFDDKQEWRSSDRRCAGCRYLARCSICPISLARQGGGADGRKKRRGGADGRRIPDFACAFNRVTLR
jgi:sulfatase maturation enzyme AslB (radical SAM superfamily)